MKLSILFALGLTAPLAMAQECFNSPAPGILLGNGSDIVFPIQPIGFTFPFAGTTYTDVHVSDHGLVFLSNGGVPTPPATNDPLLYTPASASLVTGSPMICALWSDTVASGTTAGVYIDSTPSACTISWRLVNSFGIPSPTFNMQLTLFPNGNVEFAWDPLVTNNSTFGGASQVGICGVSPGAGAILPGSTDLSAGGASPNDTLYEEWLVANTFDLQNTGLLLVPSSPGWAIVPLGNPTNCAQTVNYGNGCGGDGPDSIYQAFTSANFNLAGSSITWLRSGAGYFVANLPAVFVSPTIAAQPVAPGILDGQQSFALSSPMPVAGGFTSTLNITTKGQVEVSGTPLPGIDFTPTVAELLNWPNTAFHCWHDFDQTGPASGAILFEEVGGFAYATWNGVESFSSIGASTLQFQFELATGNVSLVVVSAGGIGDPGNPDATVVGYSVGGPSPNPGPSVLNNLGAGFLLSDLPPTNLNLALAGIGLPVIGNAAFGLELSNVPLLSPLGFLFFGDQVVNPGLDLGFLGMPTCFGYTNASLGSASFAAVAGVGSTTVPIPNSPSLAGVAFSAQGVTFSLATPLNLVTSNGTEVVVGF